ncbi:MAG: hypothetical protein WAL79_06330, partial [Nitrososphaeraceae archaeon]
LLPVLPWLIILRHKLTRKGFRLISRDSDVKLGEIAVAGIEGSSNLGCSGRIDHYEFAIIYF